MEQGTRETGEEATDDGGGGGGSGTVAGHKRQRICWDQILPRRSLRVLLVEHDDSTRQVVTALLRKCNYRVVGVADGLKAWEIMQERRFAFDLVLTEVVMPSLSGIGLLTKVISTEECKNIPVIMMSSQDSIGVVLKCMLKGAADFLVKPVRKNELRNLWQHVWRRHCADHENESSIARKVLEKLYSFMHSLNLTSAVQLVKYQVKEGSFRGSFGTIEKASKVLNSVALFYTLHLLRNLMQLNSQANASDHNYNVASNRISANIGDAEFSDGANEVQSSGAKEEMEIESAQNFTETPSAEGASSSKEMQEQDAHAGAVPVRSNAIANDGSELDRERTGRTGTTTEANIFNTIPPDKEPLDLSDPTNEENCNISESQKDATQEDSVVNTKSLEGCFKPKTRDVLNHSESSAFSRYGEKKQQNLNDNLSSSSLQFRNCEFFKGDLKTSTSLPSKEDDAINHQSFAPQLGFIPIHFPVQSVPYSYTTILHPIFYPPYPPPDNLTTQITCDDSNHSKCNNASEVGPEVEKEESRELHLVIQRGSCSQDVAIASGSGETGNGNTSGNGNLESGNESAAHTGNWSRREAALIKFRLKRKDRCFEKKVRYYNRKKLAEQRPRVKGQFVSQKASKSAPQIETES